MHGIYDVGGKVESGEKFSEARNLQLGSFHLLPRRLF